MTNVNETQLKNDIIKYLRGCGCYAERMQSGVIQDARTMSWIHCAESGTPDIICSRPDQRLAFVECKLPSGKLSDAQIFFLRAQEAAGRPWLIATCLDDLIRWLANEDDHGAARFVKYIMDPSTKFVLKPRRDKRLRAGDVLAHELWTKRSEVMDTAAEDAKNPLF